MGRAHRTSASATDDFTALFGSRRGNTGASDLAAGRDSSAARRQLDVLLADVNAGAVDDALKLLRARHTKTVPLLGPLRAAVLAHAHGVALSDDWLTAARGFCEAVCLLPTEARTIVRTTVRDLTTYHIWPDGQERVTATSPDPLITFACGTTLDWATTGQAAYPVPRARRGAWADAARAANIRTLATQINSPSICRDCAEHASQFPEIAESTDYRPWEALDRTRYDDALDRCLQADFARMLPSLHSRTDVDTWLVSSAVQGALLDCATERLCSPAGEDALHLGLGEVSYRHYLKKAQDRGLPGLYPLLDDETLLRDRLRPLLPHNAAVYDPTAFDGDGAAYAVTAGEAYLVCIACGLDRLPATAAA